MAVDADAQSNNRATIVAKSISYKKRIFQMPNIPIFDRRSGAHKKIE